MRINYKQLGQSIKKYRLAKNLTQENLAEMCNLSTPHLSNIERGTPSISFATLEKILENLNANIIFQIYEENNTDINPQCNSCEYKVSYKMIKEIVINSHYKS
ncbi:MAG: helix-turn-helix transcriptional regulator [Brachyspira sp.]|jgi:hypothetical protein|nr:helix-turn-helix transcriptional regulator [Brachyspira sp.]